MNYVTFTNFSNIFIIKMFLKNLKFRRNVRSDKSEL